MVLVSPCRPVRDLAYGDFADRKSSARRRREVEDVDLDFRRKPQQFHDLADPLPGQATQPGEVGAIPRIATADHFPELHGQSQDLGDSRKPATRTCRCPRLAAALRGSTRCRMNSKLGLNFAVLLHVGKDS